MESQVHFYSQRGLNRDTIKYLAMFTMFLNHVANIFLQPGTILFEVFADIGYFTAVTMCYFLVEGYQYTRSKKKYALRLLLFALISQLPYSLAFSTKHTLEFSGMNMIFTLFLCFLILIAREYILNPWLQSGAIFILVLLSCFSDWAVFAPIFTILFAMCQGSKRKLSAAYGIAFLLFALMNFISLRNFYPPLPSILMALSSGLGILASEIVIIGFYNGKRMERGRTFSKWFFYLFYPVHLLILGIIRLSILK